MWFKSPSAIINNYYAKVYKRTIMTDPTASEIVFSRNNRTQNNLMLYYNLKIPNTGLPINSGKQSQIWIQSHLRFEFCNKMFPKNEDKSDIQKCGIC